MTRGERIILRAATAAAGSALAAWSAYAGYAWLRYGKSRCHAAPDGLLDPFMPVCEVAERHEIEVGAPAATTYAAARAVDLDDSCACRAIFRVREWLLGADSRAAPRAGLLAQTLALGWGVLTEDPGREIIVGAVTQPWRANVKFHALPPEQFAAFDTPGYAKIVWTLAAEPRGPDKSIFRTETRVATTDPESRRRFRLYWSVFSPGILLIRSRSLALVKAEAERRYLERYADGSARAASLVDCGAAALQPVEAV